MLSLGAFYEQKSQEGYARFDLRELLRVTHGFSSQSELFLHFDRPLQHLEHLQFMLDRLKAGEPVAYLVGETMFLTSRYHVNRHVLIPRPETEELIFLAEKKVSKLTSINTILDIGTGSGVIACSLKQRLPHLTIKASDISQKALEVAQYNAKQLKLEIEFKQGDGLSPWRNQLFQGIVSNPPYILRPQDADEDVHRYEPHRALYSKVENNLYSVFLQAFKDFPSLKFVLVELNHDWVTYIESYIQQRGLDLRVEWIKDINHHVRFAWIQRNTLQ